MAERTQEPAKKPIPESDEEWQPFFDGARRGVLMIQQCTQCSTSLAPGTILCIECLSESLRWVQASGRGTLFTFGVMHQTYHPGFSREVPYNVAVVELEEGPRLNTNIVDVANEDLTVGMPVEVTFEAVSDKVSLPKFRPK
jgi:uncharacterized OB-fold protein